MRISWFVCLVLPAAARADYCNYSAMYIGEAKVMYSVMAGRSSCGEAILDGNRIHRVVYDRSGRATFGFDVRIAADPAGKTFRVEVGPMRGQIRPFGRGGTIDGGKLASFHTPPQPVIVLNGDRVTLPVMQDPSTGQTVIFDSFEIGGRGTPVQSLPQIRSYPKELPSGTLLRVETPVLHDQVAEVARNAEMGALAPVVWVYAPYRGRFLFSATARPGFRKTAFAEGKEIRFTAGTETYRLTAAADIVGEPGGGQLWCKYERDFRPANAGRDGVLEIGMER